MPDPERIVMVPIRQGLFDELASLFGSTFVGVEERLRAEVSYWEDKLTTAMAEVDRLKSTDEHDMMFNHPYTKTPAFPQGFFSPLSSTVKRDLIIQAQGPLEEATGRLAFARKALEDFLITNPEA